MQRFCLFTLLGCLVSGPSFGQNLLFNGDFETGLVGQGWTTWQAGWGTNEAWDFMNTEPGHLGNRCLRLGQANTTGSFGVYQEISVTPGTTYRIDAWWKGNRNGDDNWVEIIIIDGPWDFDQADNPANKINFMYAYDSPDNPLTTDFGWIWCHDQNGTAVDWNSRNGLRTASNTTMTVVLKAGACCGTTGVSAWFDNVELTALGAATPKLDNGDFQDGLTGWSTWTLHDTGGDMSVGVAAGELGIQGSNFDGGVYQQFPTGGAGQVVNVNGFWRSDPTLLNGQWGEVWIINADRVPVDGVDETDGVNNAILLYSNDTFGGRGAWADAIPKSAPVAHQVSFVAGATKATLLLRSGNSNPGGTTGVKFDNMAVHAVPQAATPGNPPAGFEMREMTFPLYGTVSIAQSPVSHRIYVVRNNQGGGDTQLYEINVDGPSLSHTVKANLSSILGLSDAQGLTFDSDGNVYISNQFGRLIKGVDTNPDPSIDTFSFSQMFDLPDPQLGTFHGVGGVAVGPDDMLYINSGSETHYGPEPDNGFNARILRCPLDANGTEDVEVFCEGIRNSFDISFRLDGLLFGVGNGPNLNCDYAEKFHQLAHGNHYGFPYHFASDLSGGDQSIFCDDDPPRTGPQPLPNGLVTTPAWANYGPDAKPLPGERGYVDGQEYYGFDPHSSPNGLDFYETALMDPGAIKFPPEFHGRAFVARYGDLENMAAADNPNPIAVGYDVVSLRLDDAHDGFICNTFLEGTGRPIDVLCAYNGKVYIIEYNAQTFGASPPGGAGWTTPGKLYEIGYTIPLSPMIQVSTASVSRSVDYTQTAGGNNTFTVANGGAGVLNYAITVDFDNPGDPTWLEVSPLSGDSTGLGDADTITLTWPDPVVSTLDIGTYTATVTIADPLAFNNPQTVDVTLTIKTVLPDHDKDGDVDLNDFGTQQACLNGTQPIPPGCGIADLDGDGFVAQSDIVIFEGCMSGENILADSSCDDAWE